MNIYSGPNPKDINPNFPDHSEEFIVCLEDGTLKKKIEKGYLKKFGLSRESYLNKYPGAPMCSKIAASKYKKIASSDEERQRRSKTLSNLNQDSTFQTKRKAGVDSFWSSDDSKNLRETLSNKAKIQHENGLMDHIRKVYFEDKYVGSEDQERRRQRALSVNSPLRLESSRIKAKDTLYEKYGVYNASQINLSDETMVILQDKTLFEEIIENKTIHQIASGLNVSGGTIHSYLTKYNLLDRISRRHSDLESIIVDFLDKSGCKYKTKDRTIIKPRELDFVIPEHKIAIEVHGLFYHSMYKIQDKSYHYEKYKLCKEKDITLFQIFGNELLDEKLRNIWFSKILYCMNKISDKVYARNCRIELIDTQAYRQFLNDNHLQGRSNSSIRVGIFYKNNLVGVLGCSKYGTKSLIIDRYCTNTTLVGGFSKVLKFIVNNFQMYKEFITYSDNRCSYGNLYSSTGFSMDAELPPDYYYTDFVSLFHKFNFRKDRIARKFEIDIESKTELELTKELGFYRIYDAGKVRWKLSF
jgi:hypothetical protein